MSTAGQISLLQARGLTDSTRIIATNLDVAISLEAQGLSFEEGWTCLSRTRTRELFEEASRLRDTWFSELEEALSHRGMSLPRANRYDWFYFFRDTLYASELWRAAEQGGRYDELVSFGDLSTPAVWDGRSDACDAVFRYLAEHAGARTQSLNLADPGAYAKKKHGLIRCKVVRSATTGMTSLFVSPNRWRIGQRPLVFFVGAGETYRFRHIADALHQRANEPIVCIRGIHWPFGLGCREPDPRFVPMLSFLRPAEYFRLWLNLRRQWRRWCDDASNRPGSRPEIFDNPFLRFHFRFYFLRRWLEVAKFQSAVEAMFVILRPRAVVATPLPALDHALVLNHVAHKKSIPVISLPHGGLPSVEGKETAADAAVVWGYDYLHAWRHTGLHEERFEVVGIPEFAYGGLYRSGNAVTALRKGSAYSLIVVTLVRTHLGETPCIDLSAHREAVYTLARVPPDLRERVHVLFKLHPNNGNPEFDATLETVGEGSVSVVRGGTMIELVRQADLILGVNRISAAMLAGLVGNVPTAFIHNAGDFYLNDWPFIQKHTVGVIRDVERLWHELEAFLFDVQKRTQLREENQRYLRHTYPLYPASMEAVVAGIERALDSLSRG